MKKDTNQQLMTNWRWWMVVLLFVATTVNYMDRQVLSLTWKEFIAPEFHWTDSQYGIITSVFSIFYAVCMLFAGKFVDWMGTKKGYLWAIGVWSFGACIHAACGWATMRIEGFDSIEAMKAVEAGSNAALGIATVSVWLFLAARSILALGEAGNFPAAIKTTAEYFPKKDRAFATSIFNAGASVGALIAPVTIPPLAASFGWEMAFIIIGALGFLWMGFWCSCMRSLPSQSMSTRLSSHTSARTKTSRLQLRQKRRRTPSRSSSASHTARHGLSSQVSSLQTEYGGSTFSGLLHISRTSSATRHLQAWVWPSSSLSTQS